MPEHVIDFHRHFGPGLRSTGPFGPLRDYADIDELVQDSGDGRIDRFVLFAPRWMGGDFVDPDYSQANAAIATAVATQPERFVGFVRINPKFGTKAVAQLEQAVRDGFVGLKLDNETDAYSPLDVRLLGPLFEISQQASLPVIVHTGFHPSQPLLWLKMAKEFPKVNLVLGHMGYRVANDAFILAKQADNVYLETSGQQPSNLRRALRAVAPERIIFGTDAPYTDTGNELARLDALELPDETMRAICSENARRLLPSAW